MKIETLEPGNYYHIYNRGNNGGDLFFERDNYLHFLRLYDKYVAPVADTFAWCLMKNHFHLLVYVKENEEIDKDSYLLSAGKEPKKPNPSRQFSHLFNAYTQAVNKKYHRTGSLFEKPFERKKITSEEYFRKLIFYIHNNPVHHGVAEKLDSYPWTSYNSIVSTKPTKLDREKIVKWFDSLENFKAYHERLNKLDEEPFQGL